METPARRNGAPADVPNSSRRAFAGILGAGGIGALATALSSNADAATIVRTDLANALGFWPVLSETAPKTTTVGAVPVVWLQKVGNLDTIPTAPLAPMFDDIAARFVVPTGVVGVQYRNAATGALLAPGSMVSVTGTLPQTVTIKADPLPGYVLAPGQLSSWSHIFYDPSKVAVLFSDTFTGAAGTGLSKRAVDNGLGGSIKPTWTNFWEGEAFALDGAGALANQARKGWYKIDTGGRDMRLSFNFEWIDASKSNEYAMFTVGGIDGGGGATMSIGNGVVRCFIPSKNGNYIVYSQSGEGRSPNGQYTVEVVGNQFGLKTPGMSVMQYVDITYVDSARGINPDSRGTWVNIRSDNTNAGVFKIKNLSVSKIGG